MLHYLISNFGAVCKAFGPHGQFPKVHSNKTRRKINDVGKWGAKQSNA